jgi:hypothetical protein
LAVGDAFETDAVHIGAAAAAVVDAGAAGVVTAGLVETTVVEDVVLAVELVVLAAVVLVVTRVVAAGAVLTVDSTDVAVVLSLVLSSRVRLPTIPISVSAAIAAAKTERTRCRSHTPARSDQRVLGRPRRSTTGVGRICVASSGSGGT